jgi:hypothetical protein
MMLSMVIRVYPANRRSEKLSFSVSSKIGSYPGRPGYIVIITG